MIVPDHRPAPNPAVRLDAPPEGTEITLQSGAEWTTDARKGRFKEAEYGVSLEWVMIKGRRLELGIEGSFKRNHEGEYSVETEVTLKGGSGLTLTQKLGKLGVLKATAFLATAISSEIAASATAGGQAEVEIDLLHHTKVVLGVKAGSKAILGPQKLPDGREVHRLTGLPFAAIGSIIFQYEFE